MPAAGTRRYGIAAAMVVVAIALGAVFGVIVARAIAGYDITPVRPGESFSVPIGDHKVAVWASPPDAATYCGTPDTGAGRGTFTQPLTSSMTVTTGDRSWGQVGVIDGQPGSTVTLACSGEGAPVIGYADNPRVLRYVLIGGALGGTALLLVVSAFVLALVTAVRQRSAKARRQS